MPLYQFRTEGSVENSYTADATLPDVRAAQVEAVRALGELLTDDGPAFWDGEHVTMTVSDGAGLVLFRLDLSTVTAPALRG